MTRVQVGEVRNVTYVWDCVYLICNVDGRDCKVLVLDGEITMYYNGVLRRFCPGDIMVVHADSFFISQSAKVG